MTEYNLDTRIKDTLVALMNPTTMLDGQKEALKALLREVIEQITPEPLTPITRTEMADKTGAVDDDVNLGYDYAREQILTKAHQLLGDTK